MRKLLCGLLLISASCLVQAVPVTWFFSNVTFSDGGHAVGSFVYDADTGIYTSVSMITTPGTGVTSPGAAGGGANYSQQSPGFATASQNLLLNNANVMLGITRGITLSFLAPLTNAGGTVGLNASTAEGFCNVASCQTVAAGFRVITGGSVIAGAGTGAQTWYLQGVHLDDGGLATGTFMYDASANAYSNVNIWVTAGSTFTTPLRYLVSQASASSSQVALVNASPAPAGARTLLINLPTPMTNAGGVLVIAANTNSSEDTCASVNCTTTGGPLRLITSGLITTTRPNNYAQILSQVVDGSFSGFQFQTTFIAENLTDQPIAFSLDIYQDGGTGFNVPGIGSNTVQTVPARGTLFLPSAGGTNTGVQGWARVRGAENLSITAIFTESNANAGGAVQNVVTAEPVGSATFSMAYDNTNGAVGGFALTNPDSAQAMKVLAVAYDNTGNIIFNDSSITLNPLSHTAFNFQNQAGYNVLANKKGTIRIFAIPVSTTPTAPLQGLDGLMIKFLPNNSTATIPAVHQ